jgi:NADPH:quinone reductase-like Zn-dependent oxidoreductase
VDCGDNCLSDRFIYFFYLPKLAEPTADGKPAPKSEQTGVVVWGAGSAVGTYAIQLLKLAGHHIVAVAGSSGQHAKDIGADVVINYKTEDVGAAIKKAAQSGGFEITHAYDAISEPPTTETLATALGEMKGGKITTVLPTKQQEDPSTLPSGVTVVRTMVGTAFDKDADFSERLIRQIAKWVDEGKFKASKTQVIPGGLDGVPEGLKLLEQGKVNATKLVCELEKVCVFRYPS